MSVSIVTPFKVIVWLLGAAHVGYGGLEAAFPLVHAKRGMSDVPTPTCRRCRRRSRLSTVAAAAVAPEAKARARRCGRSGEKALGGCLSAEETWWPGCGQR